MGRWMSVASWRDWRDCGGCLGNELGKAGLCGGWRTAEVGPIGFPQAARWLHEIDWMWTSRGASSASILPRYETSQLIVIDGVTVRHGGGLRGISRERVAVTW